MLQEHVQDRWRSQWTATEPLEIGYSFVAADASWRKGSQDLHVRDLGLEEASGGLMGAQHFRALGARDKTAPAWLCHDLDFQFFYILRGWLEIENEVEGRRRLDAGTAGMHGPFPRYNEIEHSDDFEVIEITAPAKGATIAGRDTALPPRAESLAASGRAHYLSETPESYVVGAGPRRYFAYRDLGTADFTQRRIHIHVVKALEPMPGGTGWHNHTMSQLFVVLEGWAHLAVEGQGARTMNAGDAMCLRAGMRHDVPAYSTNYKVLEMCIPAEYETTATDAPAVVA